MEITNKRLNPEQREGEKRVLAMTKEERLAAQVLDIEYVCSYYRNANEGRWPTVMDLRWLLCHSRTLSGEPWKKRLWIWQGDKLVKFIGKHLPHYRKEIEDG